MQGTFCSILELCVSAGYNGRRCIELFNILEQRALYIGDLDIVYGPDVESDDELDEATSNRPARATQISLLRVHAQHLANCPSIPPQKPCGSRENARVSATALSRLLSQCCRLWTGRCGRGARGLRGRSWIVVSLEPGREIFALSRPCGGSCSDAL